MTASAPVQSILVYPGDMMRVSFGAHQGDPIAILDRMVLDDVFLLEPRAERGRLAIHINPDGSFNVAADTELGTPGAVLDLDCSINLMSPEGQIIEALILAEHDRPSNAFILPLSQLCRETGYTLVSADRMSARKTFARLACVSFSRGTNITMATGEQVPIERLKTGDRILTRDSGAQEIRWIGHHTVRAHGDFAPIVVTAGTLNNENDLIVGPDHRLFVYQRSDRLHAGRAEILVKARHLLNGESVYTQTGGFVDYFQILFDRHHIIYAEGIAAESMLIDPRTKPALPADLLDKLTAIMPHHGRRDEHGLDVQKALLDRPDAIEILRQASMR